MDIDRLTGLTTLGRLTVTGAFTGSTITGSGVLSIDDTTNSTSGTTGSVHTDGGLGVLLDIAAGNDVLLVSSGSILNFNAGDVTFTHSTGIITVDGDGAVVFTLGAGTVLSVDDTTDSTSATTGSMHTDGGLGVELDLFLGDTLILGEEALFTERADHVFTPAAGRGILWVRNDSPASLIFTDDAGLDVDISAAASGDVTGDTASVDKELVRFNGTGGKTIESPNTDNSSVTATLSDNADLTLYDATNDGSPIIAFGSSATERLTITASYASGGQVLEFVNFDTPTGSASADFGEYRFNVDGSLIATIDDGGLELADAKAYFIDTSNVLSETTLGSTVVNSSLANLGTITTDIQLDSDLDFVGAQAITTTAGDLTLNPSGSIALSNDDLLNVGNAASDWTSTLFVVGGQATTTVSSGNFITEGTITGKGILSIDDTTGSTSGTTGSIHTDGGLGVVLDLAVGDDILLTSSGSIINFVSGDVLITHSTNALTVSGGEFIVNTFEATSLVDIGGGVLEIPQNGTVDSVGELQLDTTTGQLRLYNTAEKNYGNGSFYKSFRYATTSWSGTTTINLAPAFIGETWNGVMCETNAGTLDVIFGDGTNDMNNFSASTTKGTVLFTANNTFTVAETRKVEIGNPATSPVEISCTIDISYTND